MKTNDTIEIPFSQIHHLAWLNWVKDGRPTGQDMNYWMAAESLVEEAKSVLTIQVKKQAGVKTRPMKSKSKRNVETSARISSRHWTELDS